MLSVSEEVCSAVGSWYDGLTRCLYVHELCLSPYMERHIV